MKLFHHYTQMFPADMPKETVVRYMADSLAQELCKRPGFFDLVTAEQPFSNAPLAPDYRVYSIVFSADLFSR